MVLGSGTSCFRKERRTPVTTSPTPIAIAATPAATRTNTPPGVARACAAAPRLEPLELLPAPSAKVTAVYDTTP